MSPYRAAREQRERPEPKAGLVTDMVRQFADPYAFLRELIQNSIDAGTAKVEVVVMRGDDGSVLTSVSDEGSGMTVEIIESALLTLFSSTKENDRSKIGKYGVGFISVFGIAPNEVTVETWRDGRAVRVRIAPDYRYLVEQVDARDGHGTTVTLENTMDSAAFAAHVARVRESARRWCRHARIPIHLGVTDFDAPDASVRERIDRPLGVVARTSVTELSGEDVFVVGPVAGAPIQADAPGDEHAEFFAGFYNRGLTLYETTTEIFDGLAGLRFKISSPALKHTLSRDNVRRDGAFDQLLRRVRKIAEKALPSRVEEELRAAAATVADPSGAEHYLGLLTAATSPPVELDERRLWLPLTDAMDGERVMSAREIAKLTPWRAAYLTAEAPSALSAALAAAGRPVVHCPLPRLANLVDRILAPAGGSRRSVESVSANHLLVLPFGSTAQSPDDRALCDAVLQALARAGAPAQGVVLAQASGCRPGSVVIATEAVAGVRTLTQVRRAATGWGEGATLVLDPREAAVHFARAKGPSRLASTAHLLARLILLERRGTLGAGANRALLTSFEGPEA